MWVASLRTQGARILLGKSCEFANFLWNFDERGGVNRRNGELNLRVGCEWEVGCHHGVNLANFLWNFDKGVRIRKPRVDFRGWGANLRICCGMVKLRCKSRDFVLARCSVNDELNELKVISGSQFIEQIFDAVSWVGGSHPHSLFAMH